MRISKQIRSVTAKFPAQRNRELLLLEQGILNNRTGNVFAQSGNRRRSDAAACGTSAMGPTAPELCPAGPSHRSAFTRIQTRVAMHAICVSPCCGADAEGLSATTFDAQISTFIGLGCYCRRRALAPPPIIKLQVTRPETRIETAPHPARFQDAKGDGKGSSARLAQPRSLTGAWRRNFIAEYAFEK